MVVLPVPLGPLNKNAADRGFAANFCMIFFGFSSPRNDPISHGLYLSARGTGKSSVAFIEPPTEILLRLLRTRNHVAQRAAICRRTLARRRDLTRTNALVVA